MLDLKAKLLQAGLVTGDQVEKIQAEQAAERDRKKAERERAASAPRGKNGFKGGQKGGPKGSGPKNAKPRRPEKSEDERWAERVKKLAEGPKSDQYDAIRGWVERTRLDPDKGIPSENAERFHFSTYDGTISWLTLEPEVATKLKENTAAICGYMSFNGLRHCVLPVEVARDVAKIRPEWPRHLEGAEILTRPPKEAKDDSDPDASANPESDVVALPGAEAPAAEIASAASTDTETAAAESVAAPTDVEATAETAASSD